jgi:signal peptidase I
VVYRNGEAIRTRELGPCREEESSEDPGICVWYEERIDGRIHRTSTSVIEPAESLSEREVPPGHVFVLGDHRDRSNDSRNPAVGMIPVGRIKGRAVAIYWSSDEEIRWDRFFTSVE